MGRSNTSKPTSFARKYRTSLVAGNYKGEFNALPSVTQPNMVVSMREMLARHASGITDNVMQSVQYSGDLPDLRGLEPHEIKTMYHETLQRKKALEELNEAQTIEIRKEQDKVHKEKQAKLYEEWKKKQESEKSE